jgi:hypothetical protein
MAAGKGPAPLEEGPDFIEQILTEALSALTQRLTRCIRVWRQSSAALRSNSALDELILLREQQAPTEDLP